MSTGKYYFELKKRNRLRVSSVLNANDLLHLSFSHSLIENLCLELDDIKNKCRNSYNSGSRASLRYCYGRKLTLKHDWLQKFNDFKTYCRKHGFRGKFYRYFLTVNPRIFSPFVSPIDFIGDMSEVNRKLSTALLYRHGWKLLKCILTNETASKISHRLADKLIAIHNRLMTINKRVVGRLRRNSSICTVISSLGNPLEPTSQGCGLLYHFHCIEISTRPISKRKLKSIYPRHTYAEPIKRGEIGKVMQYIAGQDDTTQDHSYTSNPRRYRANHYRLCLAMKKKFPWHFYEAIACFMFNSWSKHNWCATRWYWTRRNHWADTYVRHINKIKACARAELKYCSTIVAFYNFMEHDFARGMSAMARLSKERARKSIARYKQRVNLEQNMAKRLKLRVFDLECSHLWVLAKRRQAVIRVLIPLCWVKIQKRYQPTIFEVGRLGAFTDLAGIDENCLILRFEQCSLQLHLDELHCQNQLFLTMINWARFISPALNVIPKDYLVKFSSPPGPLPY